MKRKKALTSAASAKKRNKENKSLSRIYPTLPKINCGDRQEAVDNSLLTDFTTDDFYRPDVQSKLAECIKYSWTSSKATQTIKSLEEALFRYYENAKTLYLNIENKVVDTLDNRCKPIFDIGTLLLCVTCLRARVSSGKNARQAVFAYMVSNPKGCTSGVRRSISHACDRCLCQGDILSPLYEFLVQVKELLIHGALDAARNTTGLDASTTTEIINEYSNSIKRCLTEDFEE